MTIAQINMLIVTARCLNFTEASNRLYMTTSALSRQIRSLEKELNLQLFIRDTRSVRLTPAGEVFLEDLRRIYDEYCDAADRAQQIQYGMSAELMIGVLDGHVMGEDFPRIIREMDRMYPNVLITLFHASFGALTKALDESKADLVVTTEFSVRDRRQVDYLSLGKTKEYLFVDKESALAKKERITAEDLMGETFITISPEDSPYSHELCMAAQHQCGCRTKMAPDLGTAALWVQAGMGFGIANSHNSLATDMNLCAIPTEDVELPTIDSTGSDLVMAWHRSNVNSALQNFLQIAQGLKFHAHPPVPFNLRR